jgi:hypothetical protein
LKRPYRQIAIRPKWQIMSFRDDRQPWIPFDFRPHILTESDRRNGQSILDPPDPDIFLIVLAERGHNSLHTLKIRGKVNR